MRVHLKGIVKIKAKGRTYFYAWRGGPRLKGEPGTPEFVASYNAAIEEHRAPDMSRFRALVTLYKASKDYKGLAASTKAQWGPWLDRVADHFGDLRIAQFDRPEKIRPVIRQWRNKWADKPRTADYAMQVLSRVLAHGVDPLGKLGEQSGRGHQTPLFGRPLRNHLDRRGHRGVQGGARPCRQDGRLTCGLYRPSAWRSNSAIMDAYRG